MSSKQLKCERAHALRRVGGMELIDYAGGLHSIPTQARREGVLEHRRGVIA